MNTIIGAGLAGLIAAHAWPNARVLEASGQPRASHKALLRFRTDAVSRLTGVEFRRVQVRKGLWAEERFQDTNIRWANSYAQKVLGCNNLRGDRSIWNLDPAERFIAPDDFYWQLIEAVGDRISWNTPVEFGSINETTVSTAPMPLPVSSLLPDVQLEFPRAGICVHRFKIEGADVFQTVYFPERHLDVYRASITGNLLIVESKSDTYSGEDEYAVNCAFGLHQEQAQPIERVQQKYGKIAPIDEALRKQILFKLTHDHRIYSLGRFATWRNILLDDVVDDIAAIKRLVKANNSYDIRKAAS